MPYARNPTITFDEHDMSEFHMKFRLSNTDVSVANAIRRIMIAEVPTMAINLVTVIENTSPLADEYIVHRLGLIPLHSENVEEFEFAHDCESCEGYCSNCSVSLRLSVTAPAVGVRVVTSKDLVVSNNSESDAHCRKVFPVHDSGNVKPRPEELMRKADDDGADAILIARLSSGQRIEMTAIARKGIAKDHAKHSPMCTVSYRIMPPATELVLDRINSVLSLGAKKELVEASSGLICLDETSEAIRYETPFEEGRIAITPDTTRKVGQLAIAAGAKPHEVVKLNPEPHYFDFTAETTGAMSPFQALQMALDILARKVDTVFSHVRET